MDTTDFIANHPEVKIDPSTIMIPDAVRPEFNRLHWAARKEFLQETLRALLDEAGILGQKYAQVKEEVITLLGLDNISSFPRVDGFLDNPLQTLIEDIRDPFFNLLQGRVDIKGFEEEASRVGVSSFDSYYQRGYEIWTVLSLIKLLQADKSFRVNTDEFDNDEYFAHGPGGGARLPSPKELKELSFKHNWIIGILVADQIVHSAKFGRYVSFRPHIVNPVGEVEHEKVSTELLPLPANIIKFMVRNAILVYSDDELERLAFIGDKKYISRPDVIIECFGQKKLFDDSSITKINTYHDSLKPRRGTYVVSKEPVAERVHEGEPADIRYITVGFDQLKLEPIANLFGGK